MDLHFDRICMFFLNRHRHCQRTLYTLWRSIVINWVRECSSKEFVWSKWWKVRILLLDDPRFESRQRQHILLFWKKKVLSSSGAPTTPLLNDYRGSYSRVKWPEYECDYSPKSRADVQNEWSYTYTPPRCGHTKRYLLIFFGRIRYRLQKDYQPTQPDASSCILINTVYSLIGGFH